MTIEYKDSKRIVALSTDIVQTPTYSDDFSGTDGWADQGSGVGVNTTTDRLEFSSWTDNTTNNSSTLDLGSALSDTKWTIRFKLQWTGFSNTTDWTAPAIGMFSASSATAGNSAQDMLFYWGIANGATKASYISSADNTTISGTDTNLSYAWVLDTTYYFQLQRDGSSFTTTIWTGSYNGTEVASGTNTIDGTNTGLRYFGAKSPVTNRGGSFTGWLDDLQIWNGILATSLTSKPTDVQDNSILVEKDTARRYWFTPQTADTEQAFSFTTTDTVNALWGNRIYGMKLLSGHSGLNKYIKKIKTHHPTNPTGSRLTTGTLYHVILDSSGTEIARSAGVSASSVSNNSWAETTLSTPVKLLENYTVGATISTGSGSSYLGTAVNNNGSSPTNTTRYYKDESGSVSTSTSETILMVFDSDPATGLSIPSTWNMQPTYQTDFSSSTGWTTVGSNVTITGGELSASSANAATDNRVYRALGFTLNDNFIARWEHTPKGVSSNSVFFPIMNFTAGTGNLSTSTNQDRVYLFTDSSSQTLYLRGQDGTTAGTNSNSQALTTDTKYYLELVKNGTSGTVYVRTGSHSGTLVNTLTATIASGITGLTHVQSGAMSGGNSGTGSYIVDNLQIYNGVTSIN